MPQGLVKYSSDQKEHWRGWAWNRITEAVARSRSGEKRDWLSKNCSKHRRDVLRDATVLYLCGPEDVDREVAVKHGFDAANLIAIDCVSENVASVRNDGGLAICGSLQQIIAEWPVDWRIDAVLADFCCGLTDSSRSLMYALMRRACRSLGNESAFLVVNLQRGRDKTTNRLREEVIAGEAMLASNRAMYGAAFSGAGFSRNGEFESDSRLHRGHIWLAYVHHLLHAASMGYIIYPHPIDDEKVIHSIPRWATSLGHADILAIDHLLRLLMSPQFTSYRGSKVVMDSVAATVPCKPLQVACNHPEYDHRRTIDDHFGMCDRLLRDKDWFGKYWNDRDNITGKLAALRAVRTRRLKDQAVPA